MEQQFASEDLRWRSIRRIRKTNRFWKPSPIGPRRHPRNGLNWRARGRHRPSKTPSRVWLPARTTFVRSRCVKVSPIGAAEPPRSSDKAKSARTLGGHGQWRRSARARLRRQRSSGTRTHLGGASASAVGAGGGRRRHRQTSCRRLYHRLRNRHGARPWR